jgi:hypothetical protein
LIEIVPSQHDHHEHGTFGKVLLHHKSLNTALQLYLLSALLLRFISLRTSNVLIFMYTYILIGYYHQISTLLGACEYDTNQPT